MDWFAIGNDRERLPREFFARWQVRNCIFVSTRLAGRMRLAGLTDHQPPSAPFKPDPPSSPWSATVSNIP